MVKKRKNAYTFIALISISTAFILVSELYTKYAITNIRKHVGDNDEE